MPVCHMMVCESQFVGRRYLIGDVGLLYILQHGMHVDTLLGVGSRNHCKCKMLCKHSKMILLFWCGAVCMQMLTGCELTVLYRLDQNAKRHRSDDLW